MKKLVPCILILAFYTSCKKDVAKNTADTSLMTANISEYSGSWSADQPGIIQNDSLLKIVGCAGYSDGSVGISHCITLAIKNYSGPGIYSISDIGATCYDHSIKGNNTNHIITTGSINISSDNDISIDGFFDFKAYNNPIIDTVRVTNGEFHIIKAP